MPTGLTLRENGGGADRTIVIEQPPPGWVNPQACLPYEQRIYTDAEILLMPVDELFTLYYRLGKWRDCENYLPDPYVSRGCPPAIAAQVEDDLKWRIFQLRVDARNLPDPQVPGTVTGLYWFTSDEIRPKCEKTIWGEVFDYAAMALNLFTPGGWYRLAMTAVNVAKMLAAMRAQEARMRKARALAEEHYSGLVAAYTERGQELLVEYGIEYLYRSPDEAAKWPTDAENERYAAMLGLEHPAMIVPVDVPAWPYLQKKYFLEWFAERARKRRLLELWAWSNKVQKAEAAYRRVVDPLTGAGALFPIFDASNRLHVRAGSTKPQVPLAEFMADMPDGLDKAAPPKTVVWSSDPDPIETSTLGALRSALHPRILEFIYYPLPYPHPPVLSPQYGKLYEFPGAVVEAEVLSKPHIPVTSAPIETVLTPEQKGELPEWFPTVPTNLSQEPTPTAPETGLRPPAAGNLPATTAGGRLRTSTGQASGAVTGNTTAIELGIVGVLAYLAVNN